MSHPPTRRRWSARAWLRRAALAAGVASTISVALASPASAAPAISGKAAVVMPNGDEYAFKNESGQLTVRAYRNGAWGGWEALYGNVTGKPAAISWGNGHVDVFVRWADGRLFHRYMNNYGPWSNWEPVGSWQIASDPAPISWGAGHIDVYARGTNNDLVHTWYGNGQWNPWGSLGGGLRGTPSVVSWRPGHLDVYSRASNDTLWHRWYQDGLGWANWEQLGGWQIASDVAPSAWADGRVDLFATGYDRSLVHIFFDGQRWSGWESLGGIISNAKPSVVSWWPGHLDVFATNPDGLLFHRYYKPNTGWVGWEQRGGWQLLQSPSVDAISRGDGHIGIYGTGLDANLIHMYYAWGWSGWEGLQSWNYYWESSAYYGGFEGWNGIVDTVGEADRFINAIRGVPDANAGGPRAKLTPQDTTYVTNRINAMWPTSRAYGGMNWRPDTTAEIDALTAALDAASAANRTNLWNGLAPDDRNALPWLTAERYTDVAGSTADPGLVTNTSDGTDGEVVGTPAAVKVAAPGGWCKGALSGYATGYSGKRTYKIYASSGGFKAYTVGVSGYNWDCRTNARSRMYFSVYADTRALTSDAVQFQLQMWRIGGQNKPQAPPASIGKGYETKCCTELRYLPMMEMWPEGSNTTAPKMESARLVVGPIPDKAKGVGHTLKAMMTYR